jgi:hypothetical protein
MKKFLEQEMEEGEYANMFEYIRNRPIFSAQELLPNYEYLFDLDNDTPLLYPADYPVNSFLDKLNSKINVKKLTNVEYTKIVGKVESDKSTISGFNIIRESMGTLWEHGYPLSFEIPILGDRGTNNGFGDGTVPLSSAKSAEIPSDSYLELNSAHTSLPTKAQKDVLEILTGIRPDSEVTDSMIKNMLQVFVYSPIDIQIISPSNKRVGKDFENPDQAFNEIEGSFYTGSEAENEFITIPNPEDGEYQILTEGTEDGEFRVEAVKISEDPIDDSNVIESVVVIKGIAETGKKDELKIEVNGDQVTDVKSDDVAPITEIAVSGTMGTNNWRTSDVSVALEATDNENGSGVEKTKYSLDEGITWLEYSAPFSITKEGENKIQYFSTDIQGNVEEIQTEIIKIDKTAPEAKISFNPSTQKHEIVGIDNLSQNVTIAISEQTIIETSKKEIKKVWQGISKYFKKEKNENEHEKENERNEKNINTAVLTDEAGHTTNIVFEKKKDENRRINLSILSVSYDGAVQTFSNAEIEYKWSYNEKKKVFQMLACNASASGETVESHFRPKKNLTILMQKPQELDDRDEDDDVDKRAKKQELPGMVVLGLETEKGKIKITY